MAAGDANRYEHRGPLNYWRKDDAKLLHIFELTKPVSAPSGAGPWAVAAAGFIHAYYDRC